MAKASGQQLASAEVLVECAASMIGDAAGVLHDAGDRGGSQALTALCNLVLLETEKLRRARVAAEASLVGETL